MSEEILRAARLGDEITHGMGMVGLVAGALVGAVVGAAIVAAGIATVGLAIAVIMAGCIAGGGLSGAALARGIMRAANLSGPTSGTLGQGSPNVTINGMPAMRAGVDYAPSCSGLPLNHFPKPNVLIAEGARKVTVNGKPMARTSMRMECGAKIKTGSSNVFVGGPTIQVVEIHDNEATAEMLLGVLGTAALLGAGLGAAPAGALPFMAFVASPWPRTSASMRFTNGANRWGLATATSWSVWAGSHCWDWAHAALEPRPDEMRSTCSIAPKSRPIKLGRTGGASVCAHPTQRKDRTAAETCAPRWKRNTVKAKSSRLAFLRSASPTCGSQVNRRSLNCPMERRSGLSLTRRATRYSTTTLHTTRVCQ